MTFGIPDGDGIAPSELAGYLDDTRGQKGIAAPERTFGTRVNVQPTPSVSWRQSIVFGQFSGRPSRGTRYSLLPSSRQ